MAEAGLSMGYRGEIRAQTPSEHPLEIMAGNGEWATSVEYEYYQGLQNETQVSNTSEGKLCY